MSPYTGLDICPWICLPCSSGRYHHLYHDANFFFTWAYFFSSKVLNSSANLFIYCAIGARYSSNAFCVKNFMSASLITLSNNHIFQKSYTMWTSYRDGHYSVAHNTPDNHSVNADSEPNAGSTFVVAGTLLDANAPRPPLRWELCRLLWEFEKYERPTYFSKLPISHIIVSSFYVQLNFSR